MPHFQSLYIHVPFCHLKCDYCAFYSLGASSPEQHRSWLDKIRRDFISYASDCLPLTSIFIGGGTPSALSCDELRELLDAVRSSFQLAADCEWSMEANPESLTADKIACLAAAGVNRVSLGVQSFHAAERTAIGRRGSLERLPEIIDQLHLLKIDNFNFDLMFQLPGQTPSSFADSLHQAMQYAPTHLSAYALTLEERTPLARRMQVPDDEDFETYWDTADSVLASYGLSRYEISNFAAPGRRCRHNYDIWKGATYLGCGPAATSFDGVSRFTQPPKLSAWLAGEPPETDTLSAADRAAEILAFGMRTTDGWDFDDFRRRTGFDAMALRGPQLEKLHRLQLITLMPTHAAPTRRGLLFNDSILEELI